MYHHEIEDIAQEQLLRLPSDAVDDFVEVVARICLDPWNFRRSPTEPVGSHFAHRTVPFAGGLGLVTFLILEHVAEVHVTRIVWLG